MIWIGIFNCDVWWCVFLNWEQKMSLFRFENQFDFPSSRWIEQFYNIRHNICRNSISHWIHRRTEEHETHLLGSCFCRRTEKIVSDVFAWKNHDKLNSTANGKHLYTFYPSRGSCPYHHIHQFDRLRCSGMWHSKSTLHFLSALLLNWYSYIIIYKLPTSIHHRILCMYTFDTLRSVFRVLHLYTN